MKWFVNEDLGIYLYDPSTQQEDFPNDFPNAFGTHAEASMWVDDNFPL